VAQGLALTAAPAARRWQQGQLLGLLGLLGQALGLLGLLGQALGLLGLLGQALALLPAGRDPQRRPTAVLPKGGKSVSVPPEDTKQQPSCLVSLHFPVPSLPLPCPLDN